MFAGQMQGGVRMDRGQRVQLAKDLSSGFLERYGDAIVATGMRGSVARGEDGENSNLNMVVVTKEPGVASSRSLLFGPIAVEAFVVDRDAYLVDAATIGPWWPVRADQFTHSTGLHDPDEFYRDLRTTYDTFVEQASPEEFLRAESANIVQAVTWAYKARSGGGAEMSHLAIAESGLRAILALGLRARFVFKNLPHAFRMAGQLPGAPPRFASSLNKALASTTDTGEAVTALEDAIEAMLEVAVANGVPISAEGAQDFL